MTSSSQVDAGQARRSALVVACVLALLAGWNAHRERETVALVLGSASALLVVVGFLSPVASRAFYRVWMRLARLLGWVNSRILLSLIFYGVITPMGIVQRLIGRDALRRRGPGRESYWVPRKSEGQSREQFERLF